MCARPPPLSLDEYHRRSAASWRLDPFTAYDTAGEGLIHFPHDVVLRQRQAHALARTGSLQRAREVLESLIAQGCHDPETLGLHGRVWKDLAAQAVDPASRIAALRESRASYARGLAAAEAAGDPQGYYPGINAAALSVWLDEPDQAIHFSRRAETCAARAPEQDYWVMATRAEAALIRGDLDQACALYTRAAALNPQPDQLASTRRQARAIAQHTLGRSAACDACFQIAPVTLFLGHLTDAPGRAVPRFPESMVPAVRERIRAAIAASRTRIGYAGAARGGDLLFLECLHEVGAETQIVLALEKDAFRAASVDTPAAPAWAESFETVLTQATAVRVANRHSSHADGVAFDYATRQLIGLARLRARQLDTEVRAIVLWDGRPGDGSGGTAWAVQRLHHLGIAAENIHPDHSGPIVLPAATPAPVPVSESRAIRGFLFSDCKGYSKLREEQVVEHTRQFLGGVARLIALSPRPPLFANTWGDGLFLVFEDVRDAGQFALQLREGATQGTPALGLPPEICLRIGLHAGPVSQIHDPVTGRTNFVGVNIALAARIEPITAENQIFTSEPFAALCAEAGLEDFAFEYLGSTTFAKSYGSLPLYRFHLTSH